MDGRVTDDFQFFDRLGNAAFKVFLNFGDPLASERFGPFRHLREAFMMLPEQAVEPPSAGMRQWFGFCCCLPCDIGPEA